jgi:peptidyl-tRNA hydrolase, PTH1 family
VTSTRWLVAGLGNPPADYAGTRHNVGAEAVEALAAGVSLTRNRRAGCRTADIRVGGAQVVLAVPESYMNVSGTPVVRAMGWHKVGVEHLIVVHDDLDLPFGEVKVKRGGGSGGHNGLKDVDRALGSNGYLRVRIGVGRPPGSTVAADHVLRPFTSEERPEVANVLVAAGDAVTSLVQDGLEATQNRYHRRSTGDLDKDG